MFYSTKILSGFLDTESTFIQVLLLYGCFFIGVLPSTHPALAKRPKAVLIGTFFLMAFALGIIALGQDIHSSVLMGSAFILFALAYGLQTSLDFVFPNMLFPAGSRARLVGLTTTISRIGSMGAAFAFPLLSESFSVESLFWAGCAFLLFGAAFSWKTLRRMPTNQDQLQRSNPSHRSLKHSVFTLVPTTSAVPCGPAIRPFICSRSLAK